MTITVTLDGELADKVHNRALQEGRDTDALLRDLIANQVDAQDEVFLDDTAALREAFDAVRQGRERPYDDFMHEHRSKFPSSGPPAR